MGWLTEVLVDGTDLSGYVIDWQVKRSRDSNDINPAQIWFMYAVVNQNVLKHNSEITIKRGQDTATEQFIFKGTVTNISVEDGVIKCSLRPPHWKLKNQIINEIFDSSSTEAGDIVEIWKTIAQGQDDTITVSAESSTGLPELTYFVCSGQTRWQKIQELRQLIKWQSYYRPDTDTFYFEPEGFTEFPTSFLVGGNVFNSPVWKYDEESIYNDVTILGAFDDARFQESFNGDGNETSFTLTYIPLDTEVYLGSISQANLQVMGIENSTETYDYSVEKELKQINFQVAPGSGTDNVIVNYSYLQQRPVRQKDKESIYNYGLFQYEVAYDTILNVEDARLQAQAIINVYSLPFKSTTLLIKEESNLFPGNKITITDDENNEIGTQLTVNSIVYQYTKTYDEIEVGDKNYRMSDLMFDIVQSIEDLNKRNKNNQEIITDINLIENQVITHTTKERYKRTLDSGVLYWDDDNQGLWANDLGTIGYNWGNDDAEVEELVKRTHTKDIFYDDYTADHYIDSTNSSGATITGGQLSLTANGYYVSEAIHVNNTTLTRFTASWDVGSGNVKVEMRTEAGIWRQATNGNVTQFSTGGDIGIGFAYAFPLVLTSGGNEQGVKLYYKVTETAGSTATLNKIRININQ